MPDYRFTLAQALARMPGSKRDHYDAVFRHGELELGCYAPRGVDLQGPHRRDEVYVVVSGTGIFVNGSERHPFGPGDVLFVPAGVDHRFEDFTDALAVWVIFYGAEITAEPGPA
jgi:mannose-6-phosphate isomerase-like protein (cupin superfamily)